MSVVHGDATSNEDVNQHLSRLLHSVICNNVVVCCVGGWVAKCSGGLSPAPSFGEDDNRGESALACSKTTLCQCLL